MFCKFCGQQIDRETMQCIGCGKTAGPLEGGVGFWDLAERGAPKTDVREPQWNSDRLEKNMERIFAHQKYLNKKFTVVSGAVIGILALSLILNFILIGITISTRKDYKDIRIYLQELTMEEEPAAETAEDTTGESNEEITGEITGEITEDGAEQKFEITRNPYDEEIDENTSPDSVLFIVTAVGEEPEFTWQKIDKESGEMVPIAEDDMCLYSEVKKNGDGSATSYLKLKDFSEELFGEYVCQVIDKKGREALSVRAFLNPKKDSDNTETSEQLETTAPVQDETADEEMIWLPE